MDEQESSLGEMAALFAALADTSRLAILYRLRPGPLSVSELVTATGLSQSNASNHLAVLRRCGLVRAEQQGRKVVYSLPGASVPSILILAQGVLIESLYPRAAPSPATERQKMRSNALCMDED